MDRRVYHEEYFSAFFTVCSDYAQLGDTAEKGSKAAADDEG